MKIPATYIRRKARIEIIPLIDIIFFLLATFVMVSLSMVKNQGISLKLPVASTSEPQDRKESFFISISANGEFFIDKEKVEVADLAMRLSKIKETSKDPKIFINGDTDASFGKAIEALDEVRKVGIVKVAIETKKKDVV